MQPGLLLREEQLVLPLGLAIFLQERQLDLPRMPIFLLLFVFDQQAVLRVVLLPQPLDGFVPKVIVVYVHHDVAPLTLFLLHRSVSLRCTNLGWLVRQL